MEQSSSEKQLRIRKQFDSFCKTLLKNEMIDYERARSYRQKHEVSFSELTQEELSRLNTEDDYIAEVTWQDIHEKIALKGRRFTGATV